MCASTGPLQEQCILWEALQTWLGHSFITFDLFEDGVYKVYTLMFSVSFITSHADSSPPP